MEGQRRDDAIMKAIRHAVVSGGCEIWARRMPEAASGLRRCAAKHRADSRAALERMFEGTAEG